MMKTMLSAFAMATLVACTATPTTSTSHQPEPQSTQHEQAKNMTKAIYWYQKSAQRIHEYIHYYNHERIHTKLKGLPPVQYRLQSSNTTS